MKSKINVLKNNSKLNIDYFPPYDLIKKHCCMNDGNMRQYYGLSIQDRLRTWAFRKRIVSIVKLLQRENVEIKRVLDVGSGAFFLGYLLIKNFDSTYIGVDVLPLTEMKKYRKTMEMVLGKKN